MAYALLVDIGNTGVKLALTSGKNFLAPCIKRVKTTVDTDKLKQSVSQALLHLLLQQKISAENITSVLVSSVVPALNGEFQAFFQEFGPLSFIPQDFAPNFNNMQEIPDNVGSDRLLACYGAMCLFPKAESFIILDFGTATTIDCVHKKAFLGGLICPGLSGSAKRLNETAANLPVPSLETEPEINLGFNTMQSLNQGFLFGFAEMAEGIIKRLQPFAGNSALVVAGGGLSKKIAPLTPSVQHVFTDLVLIGLHHVYANQIQNKL